MIKSRLNNSVQLNIEFPSLPKEQTIKTILSFLKIYLPQFNKSFLSENLSIHKEDDISRKLLFFLLNKTENLLIHFDAKEGVDFVINVKPYVLSAEPIFLIEAKRLPPTNNKDYVQGKTGGLERFKRELSGYGKHLSQGAMVGYIQEFTRDYWVKRINGWIDIKMKEKSDLVWNNNDKLKQNKYADFVSKHERITQSPITLYHFWLILYKE